MQSNYKKSGNPADDKEYDYIQLPALKRDLDANVVKSLWEFIKLPEKDRKRYQDLFASFDQKTKDADRQVREKVKQINMEDVQEYVDTMRSIVSEIIVQACKVAGWVYYHKFVLNESLEVMVAQAPEVEEYIIVMSILMDDGNDKDEPFGAYYNIPS